MSEAFDEPKTWIEYVRRHYVRVLLVVAGDALLFYLALAIGEGRAWYSDAWTWKYLGRDSLLVYLMMLMLTMVLPLKYVQLRKDARERQDTAHRQNVIAKMSEDEDVEVPFGLRFRHAVKASVGTLVAVGCVEVFILGVLAYNTHHFTYGNVEGKVTAAAFFVLALPTWTAFSLWLDAVLKSTPSNAHAKVEHAYREAVVDREQLAGGLELDEHARQVGGELTMQHEAGGLEVHEEVVLGFDDSVGVEGARVGDELDAEQEHAVDAAVAQYVEAT